MAKILCVLYDDPVHGYPKSHARDDIPTITRYDNGQTAPTPRHIDFVPGQLLGSVSGERGLALPTGISSPAKIPLLPEALLKNDHTPGSGVEELCAEAFAGGRAGQQSPVQR